jgi:hypothetical protein
LGHCSTCRDGRAKPVKPDHDDKAEAFARRDGDDRHYAVAARVSPFFTASSIVPTM